MTNIFSPVRATVMAGRIKISFHSRVLIIMLLICWISAGIFMIFQYRREKEFKAQLLDTELQMHNARILDDLQQGDSIGDRSEEHTSELQSQR